MGKEKEGEKRRKKQGQQRDLEDALDALWFAEEWGSRWSVGMGRVG